ncbi:MAG: glycosyltransferase family 2 protein [Bacteroidota bacterium]
MASPEYSVVTPVYGTAGFLEELILEIHTVFGQMDLEYEIIVIDDNSPDNSWEVLKKIKSENNYSLKLVKLSRNFGQHKATLAGLTLAKGNAAIVMDSDLQIHPKEIKKLVDQYEDTKADVVFGTFKKKNHASWRNMGSKILGWALRKFGGLSAFGSSFKLLDGKLIKKITNAGFEYVYIDEMAGWFTENITHTEVEHQSRKEGKSSYNIFSLFSMASNIIINYTALPLKIMTYGGLLTAISCFFAGLVFIYRRLVLDVPIGFTATIVILTFGLGLIIFCLGIIGDYLRRIYFIQLQKPSFSIKQIIE